MPHRLPKPWAHTAKRDGRALAGIRAAQQKKACALQEPYSSRLYVDDLNLLKPDLEPVTLTLRQVLEAPDKPITETSALGFAISAFQGE
jgi:hypothetical protein